MKKLNWGMIGGGEGSQIGPTHRYAAGLDGRFSLVAGALDHRPDAGRAFAQELGITADRAYGDWHEMLAVERDREDGLDLVTIATPNATHFEICRAFLGAGINVLCEKPMTMTVAEAEEIVALAEKSGRICAVNYGYSGYPLVRQMRAMVEAGDLGQVRLVVARFAHGHHGDAAHADNPRVRWRYDPAQAGASAQFADCGIHALHLAGFVVGTEVERLSADFASCIKSRALEDDAMVNLRLANGAVGRLWTSSVAIGRQHGLEIEVYGESGGLHWAQEHPDQLRWTATGGRTQIIERGEEGLSPAAQRATRITVGHAEGFPLAVANIYLDLADAITAQNANQVPPPHCLYPTAQDGLASMQAINAAVRSAELAGKWMDVG